MRIRNGSLDMELFLLRYGEAGQDASASRGNWFYNARSTQLGCTLVHRTHANSRVVLRGEADAIIANLQGE